MTEESNDQPKTKSNPPTSKFVEKLKAYRDIILAVAALATAVGSWFRPTDTTATKNSFDWTSQQIEKLSTDNVKTQQDLIALHNFLEGYLKGQDRQEKPEEKSGAAAPKPHRPNHKPIYFGGTIDKSVELPAADMALEDKAMPEMIQDTQEAVQASPEMAAPLPELGPVSKPIKKPRFEDLAK
jgi:hypothetical protein